MPEEPFDWTGYEVPLGDSAAPSPGEKESAPADVRSEQQDTRLGVRSIAGPPWNWRSLTCRTLGVLGALLIAGAPLLPATDRLDLKTHQRETVSTFWEDGKVVSVLVWISAALAVAGFATLQARGCLWVLLPIAFLGVGYRLLRLWDQFEDWNRLLVPFDGLYVLGTAWAAFAAGFALCLLAMVLHPAPEDL